MTTHDRDKVIAAAKDLGVYFGGDGNPPEWIERFYTIAFTAGAASRDAEIAELVEALEQCNRYAKATLPTGYLALFTGQALAKVRKT